MLRRFVNRSQLNMLAGIVLVFQAYCETMKGHLLAIETAAEKAIIEGMIADLHLSSEWPLLISKCFIAQFQ